MHLVIGIVKFYTYLGGETEEQNHDFFKEKKDHTHAQTSGTERRKIKVIFQITLCRWLQPYNRKTYIEKVQFFIVKKEA